jgi:hypothetical protein
MRTDPRPIRAARRATFSLVRHSIWEAIDSVPVRLTASIV